MASQSERSLAASIAANEGWARCPDRSARTSPARAALMAKFETLVDPNGELAPVERAKRAENARRAHFQRLALKSAKARRSRAQADRELTEVEQELDDFLSGDPPGSEPAPVVGGTHAELGPCGRDTDRSAMPEIARTVAG